MSLPERISLTERPAKWLNCMAAEHHYMHRALSSRACPFGWGVNFDGAPKIGDAPAGFIIFTLIHYTKLRGEFGYEGLPTKWQVLQLARLWLHDDLPKNSETVVIAKALKRVQRRWLEVHPPRFLDQPYHIVKVISYSDTSYGHLGTIYKAANFRHYSTTVSSPRHAESTDEKQDGNILECWIKNLKQPRWQYEPAQLTLGL